MTTNGFNSSTAGIKTVTVTYDGKSAVFTVTVNPAGSNAFTSIAAFGAWLSAQPANTAATAYTASLNVNNLGGNYHISGSLRYVLSVNSTKQRYQYR